MAQQKILAVIAEGSTDIGFIAFAIVLSILLAVLLLVVVLGLITRRRINGSDEGQSILTALDKHDEISVTQLAKETNIEAERLKKLLAQMKPIYAGQVLYKYDGVSGMLTRSVKRHKEESLPPRTSASVPSSPPRNNVGELLKSSYNGEYSEKLPSGGKMVVTKTSWKIDYYFPGPDLRYNGTFFTIPGAEIDAYISAWEANFNKYLELKKTMRGGSYSCEGSKGMMIRVNKYPEGVSLTSYHMPINSRAALNKIVGEYERAKRRAQDIRDAMA